MPVNTPSRPSKLVLVARIPIGLVAGFLTAVPELLIVVIYGLSMLYLRIQRREPHGLFLPGVLVVSAAAFGHRRVDWYAGTPAFDFSTKRTWLYLLVRPWLGLLGGAIGILIGYGAGTGIYALVVWAQGREIDDMPPSSANLIYLLVAGTVLAFIAVAGLGAVMTIERMLVVRLLGPNREQVLAARVSTLTESRAAVVAAVDAERRRIERDLHDGVQQRMVALGMLIGRARRGDDAQRRELLLAQAHEESRALLSQLREVSWRIFPAALESAGLRAAIESVVERSATPVRLDYDCPDQLDDAVATGAYFVVCEAVTNAAKHSGASEVEVAVQRDPAALTVTVRDDGRGGADADGGGLSGLERRVAALDGTFNVDSPRGGPTTIRAELPCE
ncbi:MAG: sensor histidine kinase [Stackebrandtia sp.]